MSLDGCLSSTRGTAGPGPPRSSERMTTEQGGLHWEPKAKLSEPTQAAQAALLVAQWPD